MISCVVISVVSWSSRGEQGSKDDLEKAPSANNSGLRRSRNKKIKCWKLRRVKSEAKFKRSNEDENKCKAVYRRLANDEYSLIIFVSYLTEKYKTQEYPKTFFSRARAWKVLPPETTAKSIITKSTFVCQLIYMLTTTGRKNKECHVLKLNYNCDNIVKSKVNIGQRSQYSGQQLC